MQFHVRFRGTDGSWAVKKPFLQIGFRGVDRIRQKLGYPTLELGRICGNVPEIKADPVIEITEEQARRVGHHFQDRSFLVVECAAGGLNGYTFLVVQHKSVPKTGEIVLAWLEQKVDQQAIWDAWSAAGFPLEWPPEEEEEDE